MAKGHERAIEFREGQMMSEVPEGYEGVICIAVIGEDGTIQYITPGEDDGDDSAG